MSWARREAEMAMYPAVADLLAKTGLKPSQVDVLGENGAAAPRGMRRAVGREADGQRAAAAGRHSA